VPREARQVWTPAKRQIIAEWRTWANTNADIAKGESAFGAFYLHLERNNAQLLTFSADNKFETIRSWLAEEDLIKI
jgi:hypothetical protein